MWRRFENSSSDINPRRHRVGGLQPTLRFFEDSAKTRWPIWLKFAAIFFTPTLKISCSGQVRSRSCDVIHDVIFGLNRRILRSIVSGWVSLLSGVGFALHGALIVFRDIEKPYIVATGSGSRKVMPAMGRFGSLFRQLFFSNLTAILSLRDVV